MNCVEELIAFQLAQEFKLEVYRLVDGCPAAFHDYKFKGQLFDAASGIERCVGEGFRRKRAAEFSTFLRYALASLDEGIIALKDGVHRKHFTFPGIAPALRLARRCEKALEGLQAAQERLRHLDRNRRGKRPPSQSSRRSSRRRTDMKPRPDPPPKSPLRE